MKVASRIFKAKASLEENYDTLNSPSEVLGINLGRNLMEAGGKLKLKREREARAVFKHFLIIQKKKEYLILHTQEGIGERKVQKLGIWPERQREHLEKEVSLENQQELCFKVINTQSKCPIEWKET